MVTIARKKKKAMVYIIDKKQLPGRSSDRYVKTILQGYMDIDVLRKSLEVNSIECV